MKDSTKSAVGYILIILIWFGLGLWTGKLIWQPKLEQDPVPVDTILVEEIELTLDDHIEMIVPEKLQDVCKAIVWVESRGKTDVVSPNGKYVGVLQLGEIYVRECNRVQDSITFTYDDRFDSVKSLQMFVIYQNHHNPEHDVDKAIHLHNPTAGPDYKHKVKTKLNTIY